MRKTFLIIYILLTVLLSMVNYSWAGSWEYKGETVDTDHMVTASDGSIWTGGSDGYTAQWNGSAWENKGYATLRQINSLTTAPDGSVWAGGQDGYTVLLGKVKGLHFIIVMMF
ncbi:MAG: hypothetical protein FH756_11330 [Firmicutes bacterium]|nr:hypothetical protein [Bacillota bacterium]